MPIWLTKCSVSPATKPLPILIVAPVRLPPLSTSSTVSVLSSATAASPAAKATVAPAATVGAVCAMSRVLVVNGTWLEASAMLAVP